ncbi:MAG: DMT family transporter, partial [Cytophagaceae bacterium]|nr:DMT family transporter [Cytophagaceae bacterium]
MKKFAGFIFALVGALLFSTKAIFVKLCYAYPVDYSTLLVFRMFFSLPVYAGILLLPRYRASFEAITRKEWIQIITMGILGYYLASAFDFAGLQYITAGLERLIVFVYPTLVVVLSAIFLKKKIKRVEIYSLLLCYGGIALVYLSGDLDLQNTGIWLGSFLVFMSALTYAIYLIGSGELIPKIGSITYTSISMIVSTIVIGIHFLVQNPLQDLVVPAPVYGYSILMALLSTILPSFMIAEGIRLLGSGRASIIASVGPV